EDGKLKIYMNHNQGASFFPETDELKVMFGAQEMETEKLERLEDTDEPISYQCMVDVSGSMSQDRIDAAADMISSLGRLKREGDNLAIAIMADELTESPFMTDPEEIEALADTIQRTREDTNLYYALVEELKKLKTDGDVHRKRCLIIFSDGADDNVQGITREEAVKMTEESHIPIFTVALLKDGHGTADEESAKILGSFARLSNGGEHFAPALGNGSNETIPGAITERLQKSFILTESLKDIKVSGGEIVLKVTVHAEDGQSASAELKLPEGDVKIIQKEIETANPTEAPEPTEEPEPEPTEEPGQPDSLRILGMPAALFAVLVIFLLILIAAVIAIIRTREDRRAMEESEPVSDAGPVTAADDSSPTIGVMQEEPSFNSPTQGFTEPEKESKPSFKIKAELTRIGKQENESFKAVISDRFTIGRSASKTKLSFPEDTALSSVHCSLFIRDKKLFIKDENSTNGTFVNGVPISGQYELNQDDTILIGSYEYRISWK
ncbi:MAG TPA: hypothetical protein DCL38_01535, partial [Lachnospiraceae bacterium]|nr:hypothetical protein [Lachnospiraceae bacterium]